MRLKNVVAGLLLIMPAYAGAQIPTTDVANIVQTTKTAFESIEQTRLAAVTKLKAIEQVHNSAQQIQYQVDQIKNMNGDYLKSYLLNGYEYKQARRRIARTYSEMRELDDNTDKMLDEYGLTPGAKDSFVSGAVSMGIGDQQITRADEQVDIAEELIADIGKEPELKAAIDLQNRIAAQQLIIDAEALRVNAAALSAQGRREVAQQLRLRADFEAFR